MKIAVDAMGGDRAPEAVVEGAVRANRLHGFEILLVGRQTIVKPLLERALTASRKLRPACTGGNSAGAGGGDIRVVDASEVIAMAEHPAQAVRRKKNASLVICGDLVKTGEADAFVSAGNTGAGMAVAAMKFGRIRGIDRPAIASLLPSRSGKVVLLDAGANVDCSPLNLLQFGVMGSVYAEHVLGIQQPRVGLLNIGEEECKGNEQARAAFKMLQCADIRFIGNVEGRDIFLGGVDVVVTDGFVGNTVLKVGEGVVEFLTGLIKDEVKTRPALRIAALMLSPALKRIARRTSYEEVGGAPLLGVNGVCIISHGRSNANAIANAIRAAGGAVAHGVVERIGNEVSRTPVGPPVG